VGSVCFFELSVEKFAVVISISMWHHFSKASKPAFEQHNSILNGQQASHCKATSGFSY